ncbi:hypothetical protein V2A60_006004 [Cordyceps javanica]
MRRTGAYVGAVAFMVVGVHGTAMTLSAIETVGSFAVPLSCIFAYNTPILGCETSDLSAGQCSSRCATRKSGECAMHDGAATTAFNPSTAPADIFNDLGSSSDCDHPKTLEHIFRNVFVHFKYIDDYIDYIDDYFDNTAYETEVNSTTSSSSTESTTAAESSTTSSSSTSTTKAAKPTRDPELGAGDPFANVPNSSSELGPYIWGILMIVFAICLA